MRLSSGLLSVAVLFLTIAPAIHADTLTLSVNSSVLANFDSPNDNYWGTYSTSIEGSPHLDYPSTGITGAYADFSSVSLFVPSGNVINSASIKIISPVGEIQGTGTIFPIQAFAPPDIDDPLSIAPTFNGGLSYTTASYFSGAPGQPSVFLPIINGNEISTGDLSLLFELSSRIEGTVNTSGYNWAGYLGGNGQADIPYTVELDVNYSPVPEPSSIALLGTGLLGLAGLARRNLLS